MVGTTVVGLILPTWGINAVFVMFGLFALMGAVVTFFFAVETRAQVLERVSPVQSSAKPPVRGSNISKSSN
jgi:putative MFS transporter